MDLSSSFDFSYKPSAFMDYSDLKPLFDKIEQNPEVKHWRRSFSKLAEFFEDFDYEEKKS